MTNDPIELDGRRTPLEQLEIQLRRQPQLHGAPPNWRGPSADAQLDQAVFADPAENWAEAIEKCRFLLDRFASTPEAQDIRIRKLIGRALGDLDRLRKREERTT